MSKYQSSEYVQESDSGSETDVPQYTPPAGFKKYDPPAIDTGKLKQKELWLIKCPKGVDFSKLKTLPVSFQIGATTDIQVGKQTLSLAEDIYQEDIVASQSKSGSAKHVLLAQAKKGKKIQPLSAKIQRYYTISEKVVIPEIDYAKATIPREDVPKEENLRMRHFPTGYGKDDYEEARTVTATGTSQKRKSEATDSPKKKAKKDKKEKKEKKDKKDKKKERS